MDPTTAEASQIAKIQNRLKSRFDTKPLTESQLGLPEAANNKQAERAELIRLERRHRVGEILKMHPQVAVSDRLLLHGLSGLFMRASSSEQAIKIWRDMELQDKKSGCQNLFFNLSDEQIVGIYEQVHSTLDLEGEEIEKAVDTRQSTVHAWNNRYEQQTQVKKGRSLEELRQNGIRITVQPKDLEVLRNEYQEGQHCPVLDKIKNKRIVTINGFPDSKTSLTVHDIFDHYWTFDLIEKEGILDRYSDLMARLGNPQSTDIFKREGENIASITFDWRRYENVGNHYSPLFNKDRMSKILSKKTTPNQAKAVEILQSLDPQSEEARKICFIYTGVVVELMEQRRAQGFIRDLVYDEEGRVEDASKIFPLLDPEYLALIVETNHVLCDPKNNSAKTLFNSSAVVEDYLVRLATNKVNEDLIVTLDSIANFDIANSSLSQEQQDWLRRNPGFAAIRQASC